jgi:hypothetical protein
VFCFAVLVSRSLAEEWKAEDYQLLEDLTKRRPEKTQRDGKNGGSNIDQLSVQIRAKLIVTCICKFQGSGKINPITSPEHVSLLNIVDKHLSPICGLFRHINHVHSSLTFLPCIRKCSVRISIGDTTILTQFLVI